MADRTLRYGQSPEEAMGIGLRPRLNDPWSAAAATGLGGLTPSTADSLIQKMPDTTLGSFDYSAPDMAPSPSGGDDILYDAGSGLMSVNGFEFQADDYSDAVKSKQYLGQGGAPRKPGAWSPLSRDQYSEYLGRIEDPTLGTRFKRSFELGTQGLKTLGGAALQFAGAEELGSGIVERAGIRSEELSPFQASAADVASGEISAIEYAVSMIGQQGPNIIETVGVGLAGFAVGTASTANPLGGALAGVGAMFSKAAFKKLAVEAAEAYAKGGVKSLSLAQRKALSQLGGAGAATAINNYGIGIADIYNEQRERGALADDNSARGIAATLGIPYAILSTIPEAIAASKLFGLTGVTPGNILKRGAKGFLVGGALEGATEAGQETLAMGAGGRYEKYDDDEYLSRLIESAVAGFTVGGTIGGIVNLRKGKPVDALGSATETEVEAEAAPTVPEAPQQLEMDLQGGSLRRDRTRGASLRTNYQGEQGEMFGSDVDLGQTPFGANPAQQQFNFGTPPTSPVQGPLEGQLDLPLEGGQMRSDTLALPSPTSLPGQVVTPPPALITPAPVAPAPQITPDLETGQAEMFTPTEMGLPTATQARVTGQELPFTGNVLRPTIQVDTTQADLEAQGQQRFTESFTAPPPPPPATTAMAEGLNPLQQAMQQAQEDQRQAEATRIQRDAEFQAAQQQRSEQAFADTLTVDEYVDATSLWDQFNDSRKKLASKVTLDSRQMDAQREWVQAVRDGTANKELFDRLRTTKPQAKGQREPLIRDPNEPDGTPTPTGGRKKLSVKKPAPVKAKPQLKKPVAKTKPAPKAEEKTDAVPEQGPAEVDVRKQTTASETVASKDDKSPVQEVAKQEVVVQEDLSAGRDAYTKYRGALKEPTSIAEFDALSLADQKSINDKANKGTLTDSALATVALNAPVGVTLEPEETVFRDSTVEDMIDAVETEVGGKYKQNLYGLIRTAYFAPTQGQGMARRTQARAYMEDFSWDNDSRAVLLIVAEELDTINVMDAKGVNPAFSILSSQGLIPNLKAIGIEFDTTTKIDGKGKVTRVETPPAVKEAVEAIRPNANTSIMEFVDKLEETGRASGRFSLEGAVDENGTPIRPMANGRVRMLARQFVAKLETKPKLFVYRSQADLKARNPKLYKSAVAARPEGDFDTAMASGYAFNGDTVVIFSDNIANAKHLNFVMAHEVLGHYGLRSIVPKAQFDTLMESIYDTNEDVRNSVDNSMDVYGQSKAEAVEEYIADYAAVVDTSVMARVMRTIKKFLNKLGVKFGDEDVRYLVDQSRKYVRRSAAGNGNLVILQEVAQQYKDVVTNTGATSTGRFAPAKDMRTESMIAANLMAQGQSSITNVQEAWDNITDKGRVKDVVDKFNKFKGQYLSLSNFRARRNLGLSKAYELFTEHSNIASRVRITANDTMKTALDRKIGSVGKLATEQTATVNKMLYDGQRKAVNMYDKAGPGKVSLLQVDNDGNPVVNPQELKRLSDMGTRTLEELRDGYTFEDVYVDPQGKKETETVKVPGIPGLTEKSAEYISYLQVRKAMADVEIELLIAGAKAYQYEKKATKVNLKSLVKEKDNLTKDDMVMVRKLIEDMGAMYTADMIEDTNGIITPNAEAMANAEDFIQAVNKYLIGATKDSGATVKSFYEGRTTDGDAIVKQLDDLRKRMAFNEDNKFLLQAEVRRVMMSDILTRQADRNTKRTIANGYTPLLRTGRFQMRVQATVNGKAVELHPDHKALLVYKHAENASQTENFATMFNEDIGGTNEYTALVKDVDTGNYIPTKVRLNAVSEAVVDSVSGPPQLDLKDFIRGLQSFDVDLTPAKMQRVITGMTKQNASARKRLERNFTPGADADGILAVSQHVDKRASSVARVQLAPQMTDLMNLGLRKSSAMWRMDDAATQDKLTKLKAESINPRLTQPQRADAQRQYAQLQTMYENTQRGATNYGAEYHAEAAKGVAFLNDNRDVSMSDSDATKLASGVRSYASFFQLGGSIATGTLNFIGIYINGLPFLASHNQKTGFGGGFGFSSMGAINKAMYDVGLRGLVGNTLGGDTSGLKFDSAEFYDDVAGSKSLQEKHGITSLEAEFLAREIREGVMIPAQGNAMMGLSRGNMSKAWMQKFTDAFMYPFNATERGARRGFGLAAYRLEFARLKSVGKTDAEANAGATKFSVEAINNTMGEYSVLNRPAAFRSGLMSFVYMYKVYPVTSIQLFSNLSRAGQVGMLTSLLMMSGVAGFPLAEDLEDLIDTLAQALGFKSGSIRFEAAKLLEDLWPGSSKPLLNGFLNELLPSDVGSRVSLGNVGPGTAFFLSGSDKYREIKDIFGPAFGFLEQTGEFAYLAAKAPFSSTVNAGDVLRKTPATAVRNIGDIFAYLKDGTVVDKRGYTVTEDMSVALMIGRVLGFYPKEAADQYGAIKYAKRVTDYQRSITTEFKQAWLKGDRNQRRSIEQEVKEWNRTAKGTPMEIRNFNKNVRKAEKEARKTAAQRTLRSSPLAARQDLNNFFDAMVAD